MDVNVEAIGERHELGEMCKCMHRSGKKQDQVLFEYETVGIGKEGIGEVQQH